MLTFDLPTIWAFIIAFAIFAYVVMDGFDLGIGILFSWIPAGRERDTAMNTIAPVWDGNETWLVLGGGGLLAAFPLAYGTILSALYAPIVAMLLALIFRGVAFEFRWRDPRHRPYWDIAFSIGSIMAAFAQGVTLGALLQGIAVKNRAYAGGWFDWLQPFTVLVGVSLVCGYALLGSTWLIMKSEGTLQARSYRLAFGLGIGTIVAIGAVSAATPFLSDVYWQR
ncbi:MAG TPA: cytochrome d ubiquinol oxidase subunit II, partial [Reyranella sp.]